MRFFVFSFSELFFLPSFQNNEKKNKQPRLEVVFFCLDNNIVVHVQDNKTFFCFTIVQNKQAFSLNKKQLFFLAWEVEKLCFCKKKCEHQRFVTKGNEQFHFFVTPNHQVMIVITNLKVFEHPQPKSNYVI